MATYEKEVDWSTLMQDGFLVKLEVHFFRGQRRLRPAELGIDESRLTKDVLEVLHLGSKRVAPLWYARKARSLESCARGLLARHALTCPFGAFVPAPAWELVAPRLAQYELAFNELTMRLLDRWDEERRLVLRQFEVAFTDLGLPEDQIADALAAIEDQWPTKKEVEAETRWMVLAYRVNLPRAPETPETAAAAVQKAYVARMEAAFEETVEGFARQLRGSLAAWAQQVSETVGRNDEVPVKTLTAIRRNLRRFRALNIAGDQEVQELLDQLSELVEAGPVKLKLSEQEFSAGIERGIKRLAKAAQRDLDPTRIRLASIAARKEDVAQVKAEAAETLEQAVARFRAACAKA